MVVPDLFDAQGTEDEVKCAAQTVFYRFQTAGAGNFDLSRIFCLHADVFDHLARSAVLFKQVGPPCHVQRPLLFDLRTVVNGFGKNVEIKFEWLPFKIEQGDQHGRPLFVVGWVFFQYIGSTLAILPTRTTEWQQSPQPRRGYTRLRSAWSLRRARRRAWKPRRDRLLKGPQAPGRGQPRQSLAFRRLEQTMPVLRRAGGRARFRQWCGRKR